MSKLKHEMQGVPCGFFSLGSQVAKKNKRRRKLSAFQRGMSWHSPIKTQGARADLVLESLAKKVEKKTKKKFGKNVPLGTLYQHAKGELDISKNGEKKH